MPDHIFIMVMIKNRDTVDNNNDDNTIDNLTIITVGIFRPQD